MTRARFLTTRDIAEELQISRSHVHQLAKQMVHVYCGRKSGKLSIDRRAAGAHDFAVARSPRTNPEVKIGLLPVSALYGKRSKSAEEAKALQIRHELAMSGEERVEFAFRLGELRAVTIPAPKARK